MQIMGFEHAYKENLMDYLDLMIGNLKNEVSSTIASLDKIFVGY